MQLEQAVKDALDRKCHLLNLPPDLRTTIWEMAFCDGWPLAIDDDDCSFKLPGIISTCSQVRRETSSIFWTSQHGHPHTESLP